MADRALTERPAGSRGAELEAVHRDLQEKIQETLEVTQEVQSREEDLKVGVDSTLAEKHKVPPASAPRQWPARAIWHPPWRAG